MAAGTVTLVVKYGDGSLHNVLALSSDGATDSGGVIWPLHALQDGAGNPVSPATAGGQAAQLAALTAMAAPALSAQSPAAGASLVAKAAAGTLFGAEVSTNANGWLLVLDAVGVPANGAAVAPKRAYQIGTDVSARFAFDRGLSMAAGIVLVVSSTLYTYTPVAAQFLGADYQ